MTHKTIWFVIYIIAFTCGVLLASMDCRLYNTNTNEIISNTVTNNHISQYDITFKCADTKPITSNGEIIAYFSQCMCFLSDASTPVPLWIDLKDVPHLIFNANTSNQAYEKCRSGCLDLCNKAISEYIKNNPNFIIPVRQ